MMKIISDYFIRNIEETVSTKPKKYLISRKIDNEAIQKFKLGFAELDEKIFYDFCNKNEISKQNLKSLGLLSEKQNLLFRERILFPITNFVFHSINLKILDSALIYRFYYKNHKIFFHLIQQIQV